MEKKKKPEIRFEGFTDDWEQRKLLLICDFEKGRGLSKDNIDNNGKYPCILYGQLFTDYGMFINTVYSKSNIISEECKLSEKGDILIPRCDTTPDGLGRASVLALDNVILGFDINILKIKNKQKYDSGFVSVALNHHKKDLLSKVVGSTVRHLENKELRDVSIEYPNSLEEQKKVGEYFQALDHLITLHQRKYEKLKNLKKSMLKKMFPQKGCKVPGIRFSGFTDDWEQRKLEDEAIEMLAGGDIDKSRVVESGKYPIYANALTNDSIVGYYDDYYRVKAPAVTVTGRGDVGHAQARTVDFTPVVRLLAIRSEHDAYFLENAINNHGVIVESTGVPQLTVPQLGNYMIQFPKTIEEETKIGEYFDNLDRLITLHQRELEKLKNIKKTLLEKMF